LFSLLVASLSLMVAFAACDKDEDTPGELSLGAPTLADIAAPTASATSDVIVNQKDLDNGVIRVIAWGFCYAETTPTIHSATVTTTPLEGKIQATLDGLANNRRYYVRAFATIYPTGVVYSPPVEMVVGVVSTP
jgi:hypothetical protein